MKKPVKTTKVYCSRCDMVFDSREKFEKHMANHSSVGCEVCPIDMAISKLIGLFKKRLNLE